LIHGLNGTFDKLAVGTCLSGSGVVALTVISCHDSAYYEVLASVSAVNVHQTAVLALIIYPASTKDTISMFLSRILNADWEGRPGAPAFRVCPFVPRDLDLDLYIRAELCNEAGSWSSFCIR
jgi:hypothetical protein